MFILIIKHDGSGRLTPAHVRALRISHHLIHLGNRISCVWSAPSDLRTQGDDYYVTAPSLFTDSTHRVDTDQEPRNHAFLIPHFPGRLSPLDSSTLRREQEQHPDQLRDGQELIFSAEFLK